MAHNPEVAGSNPAPATMKTRLTDGFFVYRHLGLVVHIFTPQGPVAYSGLFEPKEKDPSPTKAN